MSTFLRERGQAYADNTVATLLLLGGSVATGWLVNHFAPLWGLDTQAALVLAWVVVLLVAVALSLLLKPKPKLSEAAPLVQSPTTQTASNSANNEFKPQNVFNPHNEFNPTLNIAISPVGKPARHQPEDAEATFEKTTLWIRTLPLNFRNNNLGPEEVVPNTLDEYQRNVRVALARFEYETTLGLARPLDIRAQITIYDQSLRLPKYDAVWHQTRGRWKNFASGDFDDLILAVLTTEGIAAYEFDEKQKPYGMHPAMYLHPRLTELEGQEFFLNVLFIGKTSGNHIVLRKNEWFWLRPNQQPGPLVVGIAGPPDHLC